MNRRKFTSICGTTLLIGAAGCVSNEDNQLNELTLNITNTTGVSRTVHFILESESEISEWYEFTINANEEDNFNIELEEPGGEWNDYHIITGEQQSTGSLLGQAKERTCIELNFRIRDDDITGNFVTNTEEECTQQESE